MFDLPSGTRARYFVFLTSDEAQRVYVVSSSIIKTGLSHDNLSLYAQDTVPDLVKYLNDESGVTDWRIMDDREIEAYLNGMHQSSVQSQGGFNADNSIRH